MFESALFLCCSIYDLETESAYHSSEGGCLETLLSLIDPQGGLPILGKNGWQTPRTQAKDRAPLRQLPISINKVSHWWEDPNDLYSTQESTLLTAQLNHVRNIPFFPLGDRTKAHSAKPCLREVVYFSTTIRGSRGRALTL